MPVNILQIDTKFFNEYKNDVGFGSNPADFTLNLTGSVMENVKTVQQIQVEWYSKSKDTASTWTVNHTNGTIYSSGGDFNNDGFAVGDLFMYEYISAAAGTNFTGQITSVSATTILFTLLSGSRTNVDTDAIIRGYTDLTAMTFKFGLLENQEPFNVESKVSGNAQGYYEGGLGVRAGVGLPRSTSFVNFQRLGQYTDWQTGTFKARFVSDSYNLLNAQTGGQIFEIEHEFTITPYYLDGELTNLQNNVIPSLLDGLNSLKYSYSPGFRTVLSNPNTEKITVIDNNLGSVAWFNENFNGFQNNYEVNSIDYEEQATTNAADGLLIGSKTKVTAVVQSNVGNFSVSERAGIYVSYLPQQSEYTNTTLTNLKDNFIYDNAINNAGLAPSSGQDFITNFEITNVVTNTMTITFDVEYSIAQKTRLASLNNQSPIYYTIGIQLGDVTNPSGNSDRVILLADTKVYDVNADIPGLWNFSKFDIYTHEKEIGVHTGTTDVTAWNEDGIAIDYTMQLDLNKDALLNSMDFVLLAYNPLTQMTFELNKYSFNIFPATISSGVQQLAINSNRGYILESSSQFNDVFLEVGSNAGGIQDYNGRIGQKFTWQDWINNLNVDTVFYDSNEPNNNLNLKSSNYSDLNGYEIRLAFAGNLYGTNTLGVSGLTDYLVLSPTLKVYDYGKDGNITPIWSETIETFNQAGTTNLGGSILSGQNTLFKSTWTNSTGPVTSLDGLWGINRIEITNQQGFAITELSTINSPASNQLLIPTVGFTLLDMYLDSGNVVLECLIDGGLVQAGTSYNLSSRIHNDKVVILDGKITEEDVLKDTEDGTQKIIE